MLEKPKEPENAIELKIIWCHNIATKEDYKNDCLHNDTCIICKKHKDLANFNSYLSSDVPLDLLVGLAKEWGFTFTEEEIKEHQTHILPLYDISVRDKINADMKKIRSELPIDVDTELIINSTLRTLMARRLVLEENNLTEEKEYDNVIKSILKFSEIKLKMEGKLQPEKDPEVNVHVNINDIILGVEQNASIQDETEQPACFDSKDANRQACGIGIPHKGH